MNIKDMLDPDLLKAVVDEGMVKKQVHPTLPLAIYNYTPRAVYSRTWNEATLASRGLIVRTDTDEVVARPFRKFFNWDQTEAGRLPVGMAVVAPKMDGSLGVLYQHDDCGYAIATRGSFTSPQAVKATTMFQRIVEKQTVEEMARDENHDWENCFSPFFNKTYLFEILYPENRIVVDYGNSERLVLLEVIDNETGASDLAEFDSCAWPDKVERRTVHLADHNGDAMHAILDECPEDEEGLVFYSRSTTSG